MRKHRRERHRAGGDPGRSAWSRGAPPATAAAWAGVGGTAPTPPDDGRAPVAAGYRLVRVLGEGGSAVVHLGYSDRTPHSEPGRTAAVKVYRSGIGAERIDAELAALSAVAHPHLMRLIDVGIGVDDAGGTAPCLVLERCEPGGLARLVVERQALAPGEAVTILAPVVAAVDALHRAGFAHRDIRLARVLFRDSGAPVLTGFGRASPVTARPSPAGLAADPAVLDDRRALLAVVATVLECVDRWSAGDRHDWLARHRPEADDFGAVLSTALFDLAEPEPVRVRDVASPVRPAVPVVRFAAEGSAGGLADAPTARRVARGSPMPGESGATRRRAAAASGVLVRVRGRLSARGVALRSALSVVRRRYWIAAAGVGASVLIAAVAIPPETATLSPGQSSTGQSSPRPLSDASDAQGGSPTPDARSPADEPPAQQGRDAADTGADSPVGAEAVTGDDPVAALLVLLAERERCVRDLSVLCLDAVLQPGSAAMTHDVGLIRSIQAGGESPPDVTVEVHGPRLVERLGASALIDLGEVPQTQPASTLVMRGEAGWRIRDYIDPIGGGD